MKSKVILFFSLLGITFLTYGQKKIHYQQIAFEYYKDSILKYHTPENKIPVSLKVVDDMRYWDIECVKEFNFEIGDTVIISYDIGIGIRDLGIKKDKRFEKAKFKRGIYPMVFTTPYLSFNENKTITAIVESYKDKLITYLFEINSEGIVRKWCKGELVRDEYY